MTQNRGWIPERYESSFSGFLDGVEKQRRKSKYKTLDQEMVVSIEKAMLKMRSQYQQQLNKKDVTIKRLKNKLKKEDVKKVKVVERNRCSKQNIG